MNTITVKLFATFRQGRFKVQTMQYPEGTTIQDVVDALNIDPPEVGVIFVNGISADLSQTLNDGEILSIFPMVGGG